MVMRVPITAWPIEMHLADSLNLMDWLKPHFQPLEHTVTTFFVSPQVLIYSLWCGRKVLFLITLHRPGEEKLAPRTQTFCGAKKFGRRIVAGGGGTFSLRSTKSSECDGLFRCFCKQSINCRVPFAVFVVATQSSISLPPWIFIEVLLPA